MSFRYIPTMPWGKYKGQTLDHIPGSYLFWVLEECDSAGEPLKNEIREELSRRLPRPQVTPIRDAIDRSFLIAWCRRAALACHPDHGGSVAAMKLVNELRSMV